MIKELYRKIIFYTTVPKCVCCKEMLSINDKALCLNCIKEYEQSKERICSVCFSRLPECKCSNHYLKSHMMPKLIKLFRYKPSSDPNEKIAANELIYNIKRVKRRDLLDFISDEMIVAIKHSLKPADYVITNVPRKRRANF